MNKKLKQAWQYFNGKKTAIGTVMVICSEIFPQHTVAHQVLYYGGVILGGAGVMHKAQKGEFQNKLKGN